MTSGESLRIVAATEKDTPIILHMIRGLAEYEKLAEHVTATETSLREQLFGDRPPAEVCLAFVGDEPVGFAAYFHTFSTFASRPGMYLEDLFVEPQWRGRGFGQQLFAHVAKLGIARGCRTMKWAVLPWNKPAIEFYRRLGASKVTEWDAYELELK